MSKTSKKDDVIIIHVYKQFLCYQSLKSDFLTFIFFETFIVSMLYGT